MKRQRKIERIIRLAAAATLATLCLTACRHVLPPERVVHHSDTVRTLQRDSIFIHYTDTVRERQHKDTVYLEHVKWRISYREALRRDTIIRTDSIATTQVVKVAEMNCFQRSFFWLGVAAAAAAALWAVWKIAKIYFRI